MHSAVVLSVGKNGNQGESDKYDSNTPSQIGIIPKETQVIKGCERIKILVLERFTRAQRTLDVCGDHNLPVSALTAEQIWQLTIKMINRGVKVRCITEITRENISYSKQMYEQLELRHMDKIKGGFTIVDGAACIIHPYMKREIASAEIIYSVARPIIDQQEYIFETLWNNAIPAREKIGEIEQGIEREIIETIKDPREMQRRAVDLIMAAKFEISGIYSTANAFLRQQRAGTQELMLRAARERGIHIKILVPFDAGISQSSEMLEFQSQGKIRIRWIVPDLQTKASLLLVDRKFALSVEVKDDAKKTSIEAMGLAMYSNSYATVSSYVAIFQSLWNQADMYERLRMHNERQKEFLEIAAHELRTPIQPILGLASILSEQIVEGTSDDAEQRTRKQFLDIIKRNANRLYKLSEALLDVARIENQTFLLNKENVDLAQLVRDIISDVEATKINQRARICFSNLSESKEEVLVNADRQRITEVVSNLLSNALKFTREGIVQVTLGKDPLVESRQRFASLSVKDSGPGIDGKMLPRLFTKFASNSEKGMGLGLFISKGIVEAHGGRIWAENNNNNHNHNEKNRYSDSTGGATFSFTLPLL